MPPKKKIAPKKIATKSVKKQVVKKPEIKKVEERVVPVGRYIEALGRRKTSIARVRIFQNTPFSILINEKPYDSYFPTFELKNIIDSPLAKTNLPKKFSISAKVNGGGIHSQAEAVRHGISRALEKIEPGLRKVLKPFGYLKRDPRMKERRKFGLKKARKAPQWAKR